MISRILWNGRSGGVLVTCVCLLASVTSSASAQASPTCNALVSTNNKLYLVSSTGNLLTQFITDTSPILSAALSPDGAKAAYVSASNEQAFTVVDTSGRSVTTLVPPSPNSDFIDVSWDANTVINALSHASRINNSFQFRAVPETLRNPLVSVANPVTGNVCAARAQGDNTACIVDYESAVVVGKKTILTQDIFSPSNSTPISTLTLPIGSSAISQSTPSFQVQVLSIAGDVMLQVTPLGGNWIRSRVVSGSAMPLTLDDDTYGFIPTIIDPVKGLVEVKIVQSAFPSGVFDPVITWKDNYVAVIKRKGTKPELLLIKSSGNEPPIAGAFNVAETVTSLTFDTPSLVVFQTELRFGVASISIVKPITKGGVPILQIGTITNLPNSLAVTLPTGTITMPVSGWSCK